MQINLEALHYYLSYKHVPSPMSMIEGKNRKPVLDVSEVSFVPHNLSEEEVVSKLDKLLWREVEANMSGNWGCFTSGGIDSGVATALASKISPKPIRTFTMIYGDNETQGKATDRKYAEWISKIYKTDHHEFILKYDDFPNYMPQIMKCFGEPFSGYVSVWFMSRFVKPYIDVALTGDWGDELFGSYKTHRLAYRNNAVELSRLRYAGAVFSDEEKKELYQPHIRKLTQNLSTLDHLRGYAEKLTAVDPLNRMLEAELRSLMVDQTFYSIDVLSKAQNLEIRGIYGHPEIVNLMCQTPESLKWKNGETKYILKKVAEKYLPKEIVYRPKEGFITPTLELVLHLEEYIRDMLSPQNMAQHKLFDIGYVQKLVDRCYKEQGKGDSYKVWCLACFQIWFNECFR